MILLNFSRPLVPEQVATIGALACVEAIDVRVIPVHLDLNQPLAGQATALANA